MSEIEFPDRWMRLGSIFERWRRGYLLGGEDLVAASHTLLFGITARFEHGVIRV